MQLNPVYHPNLLFQSNLAYKLGLNSTPQDEVHKYSISEDLLQYNLNTGFKAFKKWFYSMNVQFKTQLLRNYEKNSMKRKASFLSPGDLNVGLGMAYSTQNKKKTFQLTATISPLSYNLKTCITDSIDHGRFNIAPDKKTHSEIGSNGEVNMKWNILGISPIKAVYSYSQIISISRGTGRIQSPSTSTSFFQLRFTHI